MNKKVLSAILFSALFAGTGTFTSCIDTDEPAGIEELRGAKAELIRAKVAVEQAQASLIMAQAEVQKALAAKENAAAEINKALAALEQAKADSINVKTEQEREALKQLIAKNEMELDSLQLKHQVIMTNLQTQLANAQYTYKSTLAQIAVLTEMYPLGTEQGWTLYSLQTSVDSWMEKVAYADSVVKERQLDYDTALIKKQYYAPIETAELEAQVDTAEIDLAKAKAELAEMEAWLEEDALTKDWRAEVDKLNAQVDSLTKLKATFASQATLAEYSAEYKALVKAYEEAAELASVDSAYSYTYIDVNSTTKALEETTYRLYAEKNPLTGEVTNTQFNADFATTSNADSLAAKVDENVIKAIAEYDNSGKLVGGQLLLDKKSLASFTTEVKALLDTLAAGAEVDTSYVDDIKAWKEALAAYKGLDVTTDFATLKRKARNAVARVTSTQGAKAAGDSLLAYYNAIEKNGAKFHTVPVRKYEVNQSTGVSTAKVTAVALKTAMADSLAVRYLATEVYNGNLDAFVTKGTTQVAATQTMPAYYSNGVIQTEALDAATALIELQDASEAAFGVVANYINNYNLLHSNCVVAGLTYLQAQPTEADIKALNDILGVNAYSQLGSYGKYLYTTDDTNIVFAKNYKSIIANLEGAIAYWEAKYAILKAKLEAQKAAETAAELAMNKYYIENISNAQDKANDAQDEIDDITPIIGALDDLIDVYLPAWAKYQNGNSQLGYYSTAQDAFKKALNNIIALKQASVREVERELAAAKIALELSTTEYCSAFNVAEANLNKAIADLEDAQAGLDKALAEMAQALEIIAALDAE